MIDKAKTICLSLALGILLGVVGLRYGPAVWLLLPVVGPSGPVDYVVVIEETEQRTPELTVVLLGPTTKKMCDAGKWRMWDRDDVPKSIQPIVSRLKDNPLPYVLLFRGGKVAAGPLPIPETDAGWNTLLEKYGGY